MHINKKNMIIYKKDVIYIDYSIAISISRQINFIIFNINKFNLRFVKIFQYFSIFNLLIRYKTDKANVVSNILSHFKKKIVMITKNSFEVLKILYKQIIEINFNRF